ncbi:MAG: GNAT family protein [Thermomicrobiales bacterium]
MPRMIKRWLRRRLAPDLVDDDLPEPEEEEEERGDLVRKGKSVALRTHVPANREAFQRWYADPEIAELLRHDLEPLTSTQSKGYFDTFILPSSARGDCFAIHERRSKRLIGTTALTDRVREKQGNSALFRIVIGEKDAWGQGFGTEATRLVAEQAFEEMGLDAIRLEVFSHNERARAVYERVGFVVTGEHVEWVHRRRTQLRVIEMRLDREAFARARTGEAGRQSPRVRTAQEREERRERRRLERKSARREAKLAVDSGRPPSEQTPETD